MSQQNIKSNNEHNKIIIQNSSCCGQISDAWFSSYSSIPIINKTPIEKSISNYISESESLLSNNNKLLCLDTTVSEHK
jgi:hypothetical protein